MNRKSKNSYALYLILPLVIVLLACSNNSANSTTNNFDDTDSLKFVKIPFAFENNKIMLSGQVRDTNFIFLLDNLFPYDAFIEPMGEYTYNIDTVELMSIKKELQNVGHSYVIGGKFFQNKIIQIDFENNCLWVYNKLPTDISGYRRWNFIEILDNKKYGAHIQIDFKDTLHQNVSAIFAIDLGAQMSIFNHEIHGKIDMEIAKQDTLSLASLLFSCTHLGKGSTELVTYLLQSDEPVNIYSYLGSDGLIGMDFLSQFHVIFDYKEKFVYLKPNKFHERLE